MQILATADGSNTLFHESLNETYHSVHGALTESMHVYIQHGLLNDWLQSETIQVLEIGFGTGLNALLTLEHQRPGQTIHYCAVEAFPLSEASLDAYYQGFAQTPKSINFLPQLNKANEWTDIKPDFRFLLKTSKLEDIDFADLEGFNLVYYDAFAPSKQPEMWTYDLLKKVTDAMSIGGILVTYCAQGQFKRHLKALGFEVHCPPGPFGKREICVAKKIISVV